MCKQSKQSEMASHTYCQLSRVHYTGYTGAEIVIVIVRLSAYHVMIEGHIHILLCVTLTESLNISVPVGIVQHTFVDFEHVNFILRFNYESSNIKNAI